MSIAFLGVNPYDQLRAWIKLAIIALRFAFVTVRNFVKGILLAKKFFMTGTARYVDFMHIRSRLMVLFPRVVSHSRWTVDNVAGYLLVISTLYLAIPHLIFFFGWLRWPLALLAAASICVALVATLRYAMKLIAKRQMTDELSVLLETSAPETAALDKSFAEEAELSDLQAHTASLTSTQKDGDAHSFVFTRQDALLIGAICLMWLTISGVGGLVFQDQDWEKHNTILNSLILKPWPTVYEIYQVNLPLVYYIGYYLPAALVGKVGGWFWANVALFAWSYAGLMIAAVWFCILVRRVSFSVMLVFVFFSGLDLLGKEVSSYSGLLNAGNATWQHMEPWARIWQYSSNSTLLFWVPNQGLSGWIVMGMLLYCLVVLRRQELILFPVGLSAFWSPFVTLGLIPYLVLGFLIDNEPLWSRIRRLVTIPNIVGLVVLGITGFYFSSKLAMESPVVITDLHNGFSLSQYGGTTAGGIAFLLLFCLVEFGLFAILIYRSDAIQDEWWRWMLDITVLTLFILPWFKLGVYNDLVMRASIPALFVMSVIVARVVHDEMMPRQTRAALAVMLIIGAATPVTEIMRHVNWMSSQPAPIFDASRPPMDMVEYFKEETYFFGQYSGSLETPFFQLAAKPIRDTDQPVAGGDEVELNTHDFVLFGNQVFVLRDSVGLPSAIMAGTTISVPWQLHFYAPGIGRNFDPKLRLVNEGGEVIWATDEWQTGRPTVEAFKMTYWSGEIRMSIPRSATAGIYTLELAFEITDSDEYLVARSVPEQDVLGETISLGSVEVRLGE